MHVRSAAYDHGQSALIDRECRTLLESVSTYLSQSGAPPSFWGEAAAHYTHTRNNIPTHEIMREGRRMYVSAENALQNVHRPYSLKHMVAFGTQVSCFIPVKEREGRKTPGQTKTIEGVIMGYGEDMRAYRVWDLKAKKMREISFYFSVVSEGFSL